jgi:cellulose synthase operon protein YhjQ
MAPGFHFSAASLVPAALILPALVNWAHRIRGGWFVMPLLCVASPKGGVGKTTLTANLAWEFARSGDRVVALDVDPQNALRLHFGLSFRDGSGLMPLLANQGNWQSALRQTRSGVLLLPHGDVDLEGALALSVTIRHDATMVARIVQEILSDATTMLIVDTPPGRSDVLSSILPLADFLVTVLLADAASVALIPAVEQGRIYGQMRRDSNASQHGYILNQLNPLSRLSRASGNAARQHLQERLLGTVSRDEMVAEAIACQQLVGAVSPASRAAKDIALVAQRIAVRMSNCRGEQTPASSQAGLHRPHVRQGGHQS